MGWAPLVTPVSIARLAFPPRLDPLERVFGKAGWGSWGSGAALIAGVIAIHFRNEWVPSPEMSTNRVEVGETSVVSGVAGAPG